MPATGLIIFSRGAWIRQTYQLAHPLAQSGPFLLVSRSKPATLVAVPLVLAALPHLAWGIRSRSLGRKTCAPKKTTPCKPVFRFSLQLIFSSGNLDQSLQVASLVLFSAHSGNLNVFFIFSGGP